MDMNTMRVIRFSITLMTWMAVSVVWAQDYPTHPIRMIVPYPPAGGTDIVARVVNEPLSRELGQPIIVDNKGGAAGNLGTDLAAKAPTDGYTVLFTLSSHTINPKLYPHLPFDAEKDFAAVSLASACFFTRAWMLSNMSRPAGHFNAAHSALRKPTGDTSRR